MVDINEEIGKALSGLDCTVCYQYPGDFNGLPAVSFYNLTERAGFGSDNGEDIQTGWAQLDIWGDYPKDVGNTALKVHEAMTKAGWTRELSMDIPSTARTQEGIETKTNVFHRTMRYVKDFIV